MRRADKVRTAGLDSKWHVPERRFDGKHLFAAGGTQSGPGSATETTDAFGARTGTRTRQTHSEGSASSVCVRVLRVVRRAPGSLLSDLVVLPVPD